MVGFLYDMQTKIEQWLWPKSPEEVTRFEKQSLRGVNAKRWRVATPEHDSELLEMVKGVYHRYGFREEPRIVLYDYGKANAMYSIRSDSLMLTTQALEQYSKDELETLIGHELGHKTQRNLLLTEILMRPVIQLGLATAVTAALRPALQKPFDYAAQHSSGKWKQRFAQSARWTQNSILLTGSTFMLAFHAISRLYNIGNSALRRNFERDADKKSTLHVRKPDAQISQKHKVTARFEREEKEWDDKYLKPIAATDSPQNKQEATPPKTYNVIDEQKPWEKKVKKLKDSHPENEERIKNIRQTAKENGIPVSL